MDRWSTVRDAESNNLPGEFQLTSLEGVRLDDGEKKTQFTNGEIVLTSHRIIWKNQSVSSADLVLPLHFIILICLFNRRPAEISRAGLFFAGPYHLRRADFLSLSDVYYRRCNFKTFG